MIGESFRRRIAEAQAIGGGASKPPDIILVATGMTYWYRGAAEAVRACREAHPGVPIAAGGIYATLMPGHCRSAVGPDFTVEGEAWGGLASVFGRLGLPVPANAPPPGPLPLRDVWEDAGVLRLNRGCPLACDYCASAALSGGFRGGNPRGGLRRLPGAGGDLRHPELRPLRRRPPLPEGRGFSALLRRVVEWGEHEKRRGRAAARFHLPNAVQSGTSTGKPPG
jgi:hypothetical protein